MDLSNLGIVIPAYNRHELLARCLTHMRYAARLWPVYVFVDGGEVEKTLDVVAKAKLPKCTVIVSPVNRGLGINLLEARRFAFDRLGHDPVLVCEDDVLISTNMIPMLARVLDWSRAAGRWPAVAGSAILKYSDRPDFVASNMMSWWCYMMPASAWHMIRDAITEYEQFLQGVRYQERPEEAIMRWLGERFNRPQQGGTQDSVNCAACYKTGVYHWTLMLNRAVHVGLEGVNAIASDDAKFGWSKQVVYEDDCDIDHMDFFIRPITEAAQ